MNIARFLSFYGLMLCFITACAQTPSSANQALISWQDYTELSQQHNDLQVIDVRTSEEVGAGKIDGAVNIDFYAEDFEQQLEQLDKTKPIVVYCKLGGRSNKAATRCRELGFETVYDIQGGYDEWKALSVPDSK